MAPRSQLSLKNHIPWFPIQMCLSSALRASHLECIGLVWLVREGYVEPQCKRGSSVRVMIFIRISGNIMTVTAKQHSLPLFLFFRAIPAAYGNYQARGRLELQLLADTTATATPALSRIYSLLHSSRQCQILNPLSKARG